MTAADPTYGWITLTTDYGLSDGFVAACHGVIARLAPAVRVLDVTHLVPPGDIRRGSAVLAQAVPHLPPAVHVAVVDPGVGTARRGVALEAGPSVLVGPDNGLLPAAADVLGGIRRCVALGSVAPGSVAPGSVAPANLSWLPGPVSATFHGRDIFTPVAAAIATGLDLADIGPVAGPDTLVRLSDPVVITGDGLIEAEVTLVDHFGNVQLAAPGSALAGLVGPVRVGTVPAVKGETFGDVPPGEFVVYVDSAGKVAVALNGGRAVVALALSEGDIVRITSAGE
jgi:S-adenosyl-L-methionine hydrolase (adenosine-forming)